MAHGVLHRPQDDDPYAAILRRKGEEHEQGYVNAIRARGLSVTVIERANGPVTAESLARQTDATISAMRAGADVVVQARLAHGSIAGYADVLMRVPRESRLGAWSYEPQDTKLARETKGSAILQLCGYAEILEQMQGILPEHFHVVTPDPEQPIHSYRTRNYLAYYRTVRRTLESALAKGHDALREANYPEPVEHCGVCAWEPRCESRRRHDDHPSFIANSARGQRQELTTQGYPTLTAAAGMPVPVTFKPARGSRETYDRLGHQARVQHQQRTERRPIVERLPVLEGEGLTRLPAPHRMTPEVVSSFLEDSFASHEVISLPPAEQRELVARCAALGTAGGSVYDALIGATCAHADLVLVTLDGRARQTYAALGVTHRMLV